MSYYPEFSDLLGRYLNKAERSQSWLAKKLGIKPGAVSRWLTDGTRPGSPEIVVRIADLLGVYEPKDKQELLISCGYGISSEDLSSVREADTASSVDEGGQSDNSAQEHVKSIGDKRKSQVSGVEIGTVQTGMFFQGGEHNFPGNLTFNMDFSTKDIPAQTSSEVPGKGDSSDDATEVQQLLEQIVQNINLLSNIAQNERKALLDLALLFQTELQDMAPTNKRIAIKAFTPFYNLIEELNTGSPDPQKIEMQSHSFIQAVDELEGVAPKALAMSREITDRIVLLARK